jgi:hypothetical protein
MKTFLPQVRRPTVWGADRQSQRTCARRVIVGGSLRSRTRKSDISTRDTTNHPWWTTLTTHEAVAVPRGPQPARSGLRHNKSRCFPHDDAYSCSVVNCARSQFLHRKQVRYCSEPRCDRADDRRTLQPVNIRSVHDRPSHPESRTTRTGSTSVSSAL